jgi:phosphoribosylformylglycinamidine synthase
MTNLGILPGGLTYNKNGQYIDRWVDLEAQNQNGPWLKGIKKISLPIAHGEGRYVIPKEEYEKMEKDGLIAFKYVKGEICKFQNLEKNPNGSTYDIAGVLAYNGRVLGMMPHPERAMFSRQNPMWQMLAHSSDKNKKVQKEGLPRLSTRRGLQIFKNAINYFNR